MASKPAAPWPLSSVATAACGTALVAAMLWSYWPTLSEVVSAWINQPDYSHGFLVAPLAAAFLWARRKSCPWESMRPSLLGLAVLAAVCGVRAFAALYYLQPVDAWTIPLWIMGAVWLMFGWACVRWALPSIVFLWFMLPMPYSAETWFSVPLQKIATQLSTAALVVLGQPALAEGNTIWLGEHQMMIEEACSGLRIFMGILALAFAFVLFSRWSWWQKALVLLAVLPIAIIANVTRIVVTGLLTEMASSEAAKTFSHDLSGAVMIPFAALLFWVFLIYLDRLFPEVELVSPNARLVMEENR
jgi:exosortase